MDNAALLNRIASVRVNRKPLVVRRVEVIADYAVVTINDPGTEPRIVLDALRKVGVVANLYGMNHTAEHQFMARGVI